MNKLANMTGRIALLLAITVAGIYCLPDGPEKLNYIFFRKLPQKEGQTSDKITDKPTNVKPQDNKSTPKVEEPQRKDTPVNTGANLKNKRAIIKKVVGDNYLDAVLSAGKLERWNPRSFPLKVYLNVPAGVPNHYVQEVKNAFATWEKSTNGFVRFVYTNSISDANYVCNFSANLLSRNCDERGAGTAAYQYFTYKQNGEIDHSIVEFSPSACNGMMWPPEIFYSTALHEIGHGLGLRGHSTNERDLMYPVGSSKLERAKISDADMNTLRAIYSIIPDVTNIPFNDADKKKLISTEDYYGDDSTRADIQIAQIQENIKITGENPSLYVQLAEAYKKKKAYQQAINAYSQALKKIDNKEQAQSILLIVAEMYLEIERPESALKCVDKAATYGSNDYIAAGYNDIARIYAEQKEYNKCAQTLDKALMNVHDAELREMIYKNYRLLGQQSGDKVMYEKYNNLLGGK